MLMEYGRKSTKTSKTAYVFNMFAQSSCFYRLFDCANAQTVKKHLTNEEKYGIIIKLSRRDTKNLEKNSLFLYGKQNHIEKEFEKS